VIVPRQYLAQLAGRLTGISDRMLAAHVELYEGYVSRLNAIEAARPVTDAPLPAAGPGPTLPAMLLQTPVAALELEITGPLAAIIDQVLLELAGRGIIYRPNLYLGDGDFWASNLGTSINLPWYLANVTLWRLANRQSSTAYNANQVAKALRHEIGHSIGYAFRLYARPDWQALFGDFNATYRDVFPSNPRSLEHVEYLDNVSDHYPQKHPDEDWAEAFACWLDPASSWRTQYAAWPVALRKLEYVDRIAREVLTGSPVNLYPGRPEPYRRLRGTVGELLGTAEGTQPFKGLPGWSEHSELLRQEPEAYNGVVLHEAFFDALGPSGAGLGADMMVEQGVSPVPAGLYAAACASWGSWAAYLYELRAILGSTNGWALTVWDPRRAQMRNVLVEGNAQGVPAGCRLLLALDAHEHTYAMDYGNRKDLGMAAVLRNVLWGAVAARLEAPAPSTLVVTELGNVAAVVP
jgi:superoxide dismutase